MWSLALFGKLEALSTASRKHPHVSLAEEGKECLEDEARVKPLYIRNRTLVCSAVEACALPPSLPGSMLRLGKSLSSVLGCGPSSKDLGTPSVGTMALGIVKREQSGDWASGGKFNPKLTSYQSGNYQSETFAFAIAAIWR